MNIPDFEKLHRDRRIKFINIQGKNFLFNAKNSTISEIDLPKEFLNEVVYTPEKPTKTLVLHTTYDCNLKCDHCYINAGNKREEMDSNELIRIVEEFGELGGICIDITGGEALRKDGIEDVIRTAREQKLRTIVLSNGIDLNSNQLQRIRQNIDGIAVGLDGLYEVNDHIRGQGSFEKTKRGLELIAEQKIELSVNTLITLDSIQQLAEFPEFISRYGAKHMSLIMARPSGRYNDSQKQIGEIYKAWDDAKQKGILQKLLMESQKHGVSIVLDHILVPGVKRKVEEKSTNLPYETYNRGRPCWDNTITIMPNGDVKCCLFFDGQVYDNVRGKNLREVYLSDKRRIALEEFKKYPIDKCPFVEESELKTFDQRIK